ncbi:MAG: mechanosensitive ion channel protein MscS [Candidatus Lloydbacteria bacterium CG22_combo_CG10-13_8_21_14_all_47_15]|uniref:Mechanosensitive ion channel protein MscS n=1 Tax=Candidatus Lloydbacteria bacterium CG22_combo_CG10-13_8_21_14_all_47_15 TaxID=1974635 RepID=A0A2H0CV82_9BACT|nr:MAG: mechanosensitive ion channel protein MscS [Candidatus Lloydbacteria bacterium CG22_combo_CG10-13_8_21_14_all_47_15]
MQSFINSVTHAAIWEHAIWNQIYLDNPVGDYALALGYFIVFLIAFKIFQAIVLHQLNKLADKTKTDLDNELIEIVKAVKPAFYSFLAFYLALNFIAIEPFWQRIINVILIIWVVWQVIMALHALIDYATRKYAQREGSGTAGTVTLLGKIAKISLWFIGILLILSNLGVNISSLIAGLGIGGIAIALAVQNILGDLFSSFAIFFDKPFEPGDFIVVGNNMGTVEKIGIKTTRIRALQGEEIVISNRELTNARIQNFKRMEKRRVALSFGVIYGTPQEKIEKIPTLVRDIITGAGQTTPDRVHFKSFGPSSLDYEAVYYAETANYNVHMDIQQAINFKLKETFEKEHIEFAYPTQTIFIEK